MKLKDVFRLIMIIVLTLILSVFPIGTVPAASLLPNPTYTPPATSIASLPPAGLTDSEISTPALIPTPLPVSVGTSGDTTGIIAMAILVVVVTLVGMVWGGAIIPRKNKPKK